MSPIDYRKLEKIDLIVFMKCIQKINYHKTGNKLQKTIKI